MSYIPRPNSMSNSMSTYEALQKLEKTTHSSQYSYSESHGSGDGPTRFWNKLLIRCQKWQLAQLVWNRPFKADSCATRYFSPPVDTDCGSQLAIGCRERAAYPSRFIDMYATIANTSSLRHCMRCLPRMEMITTFCVDPLTIDLLLASIYTAAQSDNLANYLLRECPIRNPQKVIKILDESMRPIHSALEFVDSELSLNTYGAFKSDSPFIHEAICLTFWAYTSCNRILWPLPSHRKLFDIPGSHQFEVTGFESSMKTADNGLELLFHGTNMARLHSILQEGLRNLSGSALQCHGHCFGRGIYLSSNPALAWNFTSRCKSWSQSRYHGFRVLLGVEVTGPWEVKGLSTYVVTDGAAVTVRYVVVVPGDARIPSRPATQHSELDSEQGDKYGTKEL